MGRVGLVEGTRELIESPFFIVHQVDQMRDEIVFAAVAHDALDWLLMEPEWNDGTTPLSTWPRRAAPNNPHPRHQPGFFMRRLERFPKRLNRGIPMAVRI
jgi:hypothetical protein